MNPNPYNNESSVGYGTQSSTPGQESSPTYSQQSSDDFTQIRKELNEVKDKVKELELNKLSKLSPPEEKKQASEAVFELLSDTFFDDINFISFPFSQTNSVTDTVNFFGESRLTDTSEGKFLDPSKRSRTRCNFYVSNPDDTLGYVLSPAVYDIFTSLNSFPLMSIFRSYVGIKIDRGKIYVVVKEDRKDEVLYPTSFSLSGSGASTTLTLEIKYNVNFTVIKIDGKEVGSFPTNFDSSRKPGNAFLSLMSPAKSYTGAAIGITVENFQFIQDK